MLETTQSRKLGEGRFNVYIMATLAERVTEAIHASGVSVSHVAKVCAVTPQAVYAWMKGETLELMGDNVIELAELTGFEARWIAKEIGPKLRIYVKTPQQVQVLKAMESMPPHQRDMVVKIVDTLAQQSTGPAHSGDKAA